MAVASMAVLVGCILWVATPVAAQDAVQEPAPADDELAALEAMAEDAYVQDDLETAIALYRQLARRQDDLDAKTRALMTVASLEHYRGRTDAALQILGEVLRLDPDYPFRPELYSEDFAPLFYDARTRADEERTARSAKLVSAAVDAMRRDDAASARQALDEALELEPDDGAALYNRALLDLRQGRLDRAMGGFQKVIALHAAQEEARDLPEDSPRRISPSTLAKSLTNAGMIHLRQENWDDAATSLERAVEINPTNRVAWSNLGLARLSLGRPSAAADALERAHELEPDDAGTIASLASAHLQAGDPASAARLLEGVAEEHPDRADLWLHLGTAQRRLDRAEAAVRSLERALGADADNAAGVGVQAATELAALHQRRGNARASLDAAQRVLAWRADSVDALIYEGLARQELGDLEGAAESLQAARRLAPTRAEIHLNLGTVLYRQTRYADAEAAFERALELNPDSRAARSNLSAARQAQTSGATPPSRRGERASAPEPAQPPPRTSDSSTRSRSGDEPEPSRPSGRRAAALGLFFSDIDYAALGLEGAMVETVRNRSAAARAGIRDGDLLLRLAGEKIPSPSGFEGLLGGLPSGRTVTLELLRDDRPLEVEVRIP